MLSVSRASAIKRSRAIVVVVFEIVVEVLADADVVASRVVGEKA